MNIYSDNDNTKKLNVKLQAVSGLILTGAGLSMAVDAGIKREKKNSWFWYGTMALVIFNAGLSLVAGSVRYSGK